MAIELQRQEGFTRRFPHEVLDKRVRPALEVGYIDDVQVGLSADYLGYGDDSPAQLPVHVVVDVVDRHAGCGQAVHGDAVDAVVIPQLSAY